MSTSLDKLARGGFSIGIELPLDNDWSLAGAAKRQHDGRRPGVPDLTLHATLARLADTLGFRALWVRDVPVYDPSFGDAA
ncbi:LLM class flavin-dependent oxidoreductase, partial [Paraburkholderia sp. SIMBA_049]